MELQLVGSLEVGPLRCWDLIPHTLLFPGAQQLFQALNSHPLPRANSPWNLCLPSLFGLWAQHQH